MAVLSRYGLRDQVMWRSLVPRPDGSVFVQGFLESYNRIQVPPVQPPENRSGKLGTIHRAPAREGTMLNTMMQAQADVGPLRHRYEISRQLSATGRAWLITMRDDQGREAVVSRLRSYREGNGF